MNQKLEEYNSLSTTLFAPLNIKDELGLSLPGNNFFRSSPIFSIRHSFVIENADIF